MVFDTLEWYLVGLMVVAGVMGWVAIRARDRAPKK
jgi:hypothetical protein